MLKSPVFDGSEYSLGSNGDPPANARAGSKATGGGCLKKGTPFANFTTNMGPFSMGLRYNPRCIKRDLNTNICIRFASLRNTTQPILESKDIEVFQAMIQGDARVRAAIKVGQGTHGGGHYAISGDPGGDFYFSPLEPGFYLHHGNIDRMHFIWQNLDWENRQVRSRFALFPNPLSGRRGCADHGADHRRDEHHVQLAAYPRGRQVGQHGLRAAEPERNDRADARHRGRDASLLRVRALVMDGPRVIFLARCSRISIFERDKRCLRLGILVVGAKQIFVQLKL